jgi:hypothetical protein
MISAALVRNRICLPTRRSRISARSSRDISSSTGGYPSLPAHSGLSPCCIRHIFFVPAFSVIFFFSPGAVAIFGWSGTAPSGGISFRSCAFFALMSFTPEDAGACPGATGVLTSASASGLAAPAVSSSPSPATPLPNSSYSRMLPRIRSGVP